MSSAKTGVLNKDEAEKVAIVYTPRKFPLTITPNAQSFHSLQTEQNGSSFKIDKIVARHTGVEELERLSLEKKVETEALAKLKEVQESAYQQAYDLGLQEGRAQAYGEHNAVLTERLNSFEALLLKIENLKAELVTANETHLVKLVYHLASRLAMEEITSRQELIGAVIRSAIGDVQAEERMTLKLAPSDLEFVEAMKSKANGELNAFKNMKIEESAAISPGGCVIETNYGVVDATVEKRVQKLWEALADKLPKVKDSVGSTEND